MSTFDAVRNRKRGEEAKQRVLNRTHSPKEEKQQESAFSSVRNRQTDAPVADPAKGTPMSELLKQTGILFKDPRNTELTSPFKQSTAPVVTPVQPKNIDFKAQSTQRSTPIPSPFAGKTLAPINSTPNNIQQTLQGKLPAASLLQQTGKGPANASQIPTTEYEKRKRDIANSKIDIPFSDKEINTPAPMKAWANTMNYLAFGNPLGLTVSNSLSGNSGVTQRDTTGNKTVDKVTDLVNNLVTPYITPTGAAVGGGANLAPYEAAKKVLSTKPGMQYTNYVADSLLKRGLVPKGNAATANRIANNTIAETIAGSMQNVAAGLMNGQDSNNDILTNAQMGIAGGIGLGFGGSFLSELLSKSGIPEAEIAELLALPEGSPRLNRKAQAGVVKDLGTSTDSVVNPYTFGLDEATPSTINRSANAAEGRTALSEIDQSIHDLNTKYELAVIDEYKALKEQRDNPKGVQQGELYFDADGNVTGRRGRLSNNDRWYQEAIKENGYKKLSNKKLWEQARKHIDEGFETEAGRAPSWKQENAYDEQIAAFTEVKETMRQSVREIDPALNVTDTPLKEQVLKDIRKPVVQAKLEIKPKIEATLQTTPETVKTPSKPTLEPVVKDVEEAIEAANNPRVRDRVYNFADDAEKAARERIAKRKGQLNSTPIPEWTDYSIIMAAKLVKGTIKATNFTEELVKEFGESVRPHGDKILRMSREEIRKQERVASKEGIEALEFNNATTGDTSSFSQKISRNIEVKKKPFAERWQQWRTQASDDLAALSDVEKKVRGGKLASAEDSLYKSARMFKGAPERASQIVQDRLGSVIQQVEKAGNTVDDLEMFALAKHAQDVNAAGYKSGFTNQEIKSVLDELTSPEMIAAQQELVKVNRDMLKELVDSGVVSKELYDVLGDRWENYIPLFREMESEKVGFDGGMSKALANVTIPIKALQGSEKKVIAPLENMVKNIFQSVNAAERNKVAQQIPKLAEIDTEGAFFRKLQNSELVGEKNVVKVKVDGKEVRYEVEPEIYKALMNLDQESSNTLMNILSKPASLLRAGATLTPEFALRNPIRDINNAFVVSESGFNPITDFGVGLIQSIKKGDLYKEWIDNLGAYGNTLSMDRNVHKKALETVLKQPNSKKFVNFVTGKSLINVLRAISDTTESATKVGEYRAALRSGASKQEAAYRSRDLMDFARAGSSIRPANKIVAFLNANIQGKSKLIRAIKNDPGGVIARGFVSVTMPTLAIFTLNHEFANETQKNTISNAPDWMKDSFWLMAIPGTDTVARIPKPFDLAAVFANLPEKAMAFTLEKDPEAFQGYVNRTLKDASLPTQISGLLPMIEGMANYSFFKEGSIIPRAEQALEWSDQYDPVRTTSSARIIASGVEKLTGGKGSFKNFSSPRVVDNTIQGLTAGVGKYVTDAVDVILDKTGVFKRTAKPEKSIEQAPFTRAFLVDQNQGGKAMDKFYNMKDELTKEKASAKLNNRPFAKQGQLDSIGNVADAMSDINKAIKRIEKGDLSSSQKKEKIEPLIKKRNEMIQRTMKYFKDQNKVIK